MDLSDDEHLLSNELVVDKILKRRLVVIVICGIPRPEHYEYLVSFVGFPRERNSWEPHHNLSGTMKLVEFHKLVAEKNTIRAF